MADEALSKSGVMEGLADNIVRAITPQNIRNGFESVWRRTPAYVAVLSQTGTNPPSATVIDNYLSGEVDWEYVGVGVYRMLCTNAFTSGKTALPMPNLPTDATTSAFKASLKWIDAGTVELRVEDTTGAPVNNWSNLHMNITVYP